MIFEVYLPVTDEHGAQAPPTLFLEAFDELAEQFGFVETWTAYRPLTETEDDVSEQELYRFQVDVRNSADNCRWLLRWRRTQSQRFGTEPWMIRYRLP